MKRSAGVLMHISSLPSKFGIGTLGECAFNFVRFLKNAKLKFWQVLPVCQIDETGSPYQSFSTFAGNELLIDLQILEQQGLIKGLNCADFDWGQTSNRVNFNKLKQNKNLVLKHAFSNFMTLKGEKKLLEFINKHDWFLNFAMFKILFNKFNKQFWWTWPAEFKFRKKSSLENLQKNHHNEILQIAFEQFIFFQQWHKLKTFANENGISIIGDLPIYVAGNSADVWVNPENFNLNENLQPKKVSGCPPDEFAIDGQLWGHPVYNWQILKEKGFDWWVKRLNACYLLFDWLRIDHFRGFESYFSIDSNETTARNGVWVKGPGFEFFEQIEKKLGKLNLIAEDLGFLTNEVKTLLKQTGFAGMKILQSGFDLKNSNSSNVHLPHNYEKNYVCYTGTHDNNTIVGWFNQIDEKLKNYCKAYLNFENEPIHWVFVRAAMSSVCNLAIIPLQDFLGLDGSCRMNTPGTIKNNWQWRLNELQFQSLQNLTKKISNLVEIYGRNYSF